MENLIYLFFAYKVNDSEFPTRVVRVPTESRLKDDPVKNTLPNFGEISSLAACRAKHLPALGL